MDFFEFLDSAVTPFHTVSELKKAFEKAGFGKDSVFERNGALIVVRLPRKVNSNTRFRIALAHTDFLRSGYLPIPTRTVRE